MALCPVPPRPEVRHSARRLGCGSLTPDMLGIPRVLLPFGLCGLVLVGCSITGSAKPPPAVEAPTRHVLHNGVRVLVQEYPSSEVVAVQLWVRAGGRDEAAAELGLAHYLEHMLFKGTTTRPRGFIDRDVEGVGGRMNAGTSLDFTFYHAVLPAPRAAATIEMLASLTPKKTEVQRPGTLAYLGMGWLGPRLDHADTPAVELLVSILGQSRSSRLVQSLRERLALVNSVGSDYAALETGGAVTVIAQLEAENLARAEAEILSEIRRIREQGVTDEELRRAITRAEADHEFESETAEGRARLFGRAETVWRLTEELAYIDRLRSVKPDQIRLAARRYLDLERYGRLAFVPQAR